ncbi:MAG: hypothetical protein JWM53_1281 [bacterium]|nr:hypothetical protein [bacterium]
MRLSSSVLAALSACALSSCALVAAGCGDDTTSGAGGDMSIVHDLASGGAAPTCAAYCAKVQMNCTTGDGGGNVQYASVSECTNYCTTAAGWPAGATGDQMGNTIGCRLYHAGAAAADPVTHCPHAGPTGGGLCGSLCENYCQLMAKNCTGANAVYDAATCASKCGMIPNTGMVNAMSGDSVQCRIYHLSAAAADPVLHCPHSKIKADLPTGPCT